MGEWMGGGWIDGKMDIEQQLNIQDEDNVGLMEKWIDSWLDGWIDN